MGRHILRLAKGRELHMGVKGKGWDIVCRGKNIAISIQHGNAIQAAKLE